jgi:hypothetical protein
LVPATDRAGGHCAGGCPAAGNRCDGRAASQPDPGVVNHSAPADRHHTRGRPEPGSRSTAPRQLRPGPATGTANPHRRHRAATGNTGGPGARTRGHGAAARVAAADPGCAPAGREHRRRTAADHGDARACHRPIDAYDAYTAASPSVDSADTADTADTGAPALGATARRVITPQGGRRKPESALRLRG